jgi:DNA glycosylase AlkZ-like
VDADQVLAFRLARSGLAARDGRGLAEAAACPASDFARDAALLALGARAGEVDREAYAAAVDAGEVVVAHVIRGAIHAIRPEDFALYGRALVARNERELIAQLGRKLKAMADDGLAVGDALDEVAAAIRDALAGRGALTKNELHEQLRARVRDELLPWCPGCESHHVPPMLWRYATIKAGVRLTSDRRYTLGKPGAKPAAAEAVRRFLRFYGPATPREFGDWAGLAPSHARRLWEEVPGELAEVRLGDEPAWLMADDLSALESPPEATGVRLLPAGDPYLQKPNRALIAADPELRKRLFRPVASPGAVVTAGRLTGLWRLRVKGARAQITVETLGRIRRGDLEEEASRVARLRGAAGAELELG